MADTGIFMGEKLEHHHPGVSGVSVKYGMCSSKSEVVGSDGAT